MAVSHMPLEMSGVKVVGEYEDKIFKKGRLVKTIEGHNLVVDSFLILAMLLMKSEEGHKGIQYWAIGSGSSGWDETPVEPTAGETKLTNEIGRLPILPEKINFLDENYEITTIPTNILQIEAEFDAQECNGQWREFGLFGGNATATIDSGLMIDKKHHELITKTEEMTIARKLRLSIQFSS